MQYARISGQLVPEPLGIALARVTRRQFRECLRESAPSNPRDADSNLLLQKNNWTARLTPGFSRAEALRSLDEIDEQEHILVHPGGSLEIRQTLVPLNRSIERFGNSKVNNRPVYRIESYRVGNRPAVALAQPEILREHFARGQFEDLPDKEKIAAADFEMMPAGIRLGAGQVFDIPTEVESTGNDFEEFVLRPDELVAPGATRRFSVTRTTAAYNWQSERSLNLSAVRTPADANRPEEVFALLETLPDYRHHVEPVARDGAGAPCRCRRRRSWPRPRGWQPACDASAAASGRHVATEPAGCRPGCPPNELVDACLRACEGRTTVPRWSRAAPMTFAAAAWAFFALSLYAIGTFIAHPPLIGLGSQTMTLFNSLARIDVLERSGVPESTPERQALEVFVARVHAPLASRAKSFGGLLGPYRRLAQQIARRHRSPTDAELQAAAATLKTSYRRLEPQTQICPWPSSPCCCRSQRIANELRINPPRPVALRVPHRRHLPGRRPGNRFPASNAAPPIWRSRAEHVSRWRLPVKYLRRTLLDPDPWHVATGDTHRAGRKRSDEKYDGAGRDREPPLHNGRGACSDVSE